MLPEKPQPILPALKWSSRGPTDLEQDLEEAFDTIVATGPFQYYPKTKIATFSIKLLLNT